ncbi:hypothetical protein FBULB1_11872 [Fusarium bulbicola]|nr:hypothetical protein FBULB1_11872 [Fusarium bulbicola]
MIGNGLSLRDREKVGEFINRCSLGRLSRSGERQQRDGDGVIHEKRSEATEVLEDGLSTGVAHGPLFIFSLHNNRSRRSGGRVSLRCIIEAVMKGNGNHDRPQRDLGEEGEGLWLKGKETNKYDRPCGVEGRDGDDEGRVDAGEADDDEDNAERAQELRREIRRLKKDIRARQNRHKAYTGVRSVSGAGPSS